MCVYFRFFHQCHITFSVQMFPPSWLVIFPKYLIVPVPALTFQAHLILKSLPNIFYCIRDTDSSVTGERREVKYFQVLEQSVRLHQEMWLISWLDCTWAIPLWNVFFKGEAMQVCLYFSELMPSIWVLIFFQDLQGLVMQPFLNPW